MRLVIIDLIPALLSWEGRDRGGEPTVAPDAVGAIEHLASHFSISGIVDAGRAPAEMRRHLERDHLDVYFESIGSSAEFGPVVSARVIRRLAASIKLTHRDLTVVTARPSLAAGLRAERFHTVMTSQAEFATVDTAVERALEGRFTP